MLDQSDSDQVDAFADGVGSCLNFVLCGKQTYQPITIIPAEAETFPVRSPAKAECYLERQEVLSPSGDLKDLINHEAGQSMFNRIE